MAKYYMTNGVEITREAFLEFYSNSYWIQNNPMIDKHVLELRNKNKCDWKVNDVFVALAWKMGCIKSWNDGLVFYNGWDKDSHVVTRNKRKYFTEEDFEQILGVCKGANGTLKSYLNGFKNVKGIGPVYAVALRYFMEAQFGENVLIYDQFAQRGIDAIIGEVEPRTKISYKEPTFANMEKLYLEYKEKVESVFRDKCNFRKVDQALWVYGHLFVNGKQ